MHIKHLHCMIEELAGGLRENVTACMKPDEVCIIGATVDMLKDLCEAEYYARMAKCLEKDEEEEKEEEKYLLRMLKEEHGDEYKRMREEYGEDEGERRFYDNYRYKRTGEFAPKGRGSYMPRSSGRRGRRGYVEPPYLHMPYDYRYDMDDYDYADAERMRDMDRKGMNRLYFSEPMSGRDMGGYSGRRDGDMSNFRAHDAREGKSWEKRRGYMETKEMHKDNTPESKQHRMKELDSYAKDLTEDVVDMIADASPEERALLKQKMQILVQKLG